MRRQGRLQSSAETPPMHARPTKSACARELGRAPWLALFLLLALVLPAASEGRSRDSDRDGLSNRYEQNRSHTNPRKADTDADGLRDGFELRRSRTDPRRKDTDGDGLSDGFEVNGSRTSPLRADTDRD